MEPVIGRFRGSAHVIVDGNAAFRAIVPPDAFGLPVREAFPQERFREVQSVMDEVWADGEPRVVHENGNVITIARLADDQGHPLGIATLARARNAAAFRDRLELEWIEPVEAR